MDDPDAMLTTDDLLAWEGEYGPLPDGAAVMMFSGWEERLSEPERFRQRRRRRHAPLSRLLTRSRRVFWLVNVTLSVSGSTPCRSTPVSRKPLTFI